MKARYPGKCAGEGDRVTPGDEVVKDGRGWSHPAHRHGGLYAGDAAAHGRRYDYIERTVGRMAADEFDDGVADRLERERDDAEYAAGIEDANRYRFTRDMLGEEAAVAEEYARDLRGLNGDW